jgi:hypothetical protein
MSFAKRVVRMRTRAAILSTAEKSSDPFAIAAENIHMKGELDDLQHVREPRASSLYQACMRMHVLGTHYGTTYQNWNGLRDRLVYGIGNSVHWWLQNTPDVFGDRRRGWWKCQACGETRYFGAPPTKRCKYCNALPAASIYHEHEMIIQKPYPLRGHPDMFFEKIKGIFRVSELKSMSGEEFPKLKYPDISHLWQLNAYIWGGAYDTTLPVPLDQEVGYIVYVAKKEQKGTLPIKMFACQRDEALIGRIKRKLGVYRDGCVDFPKNIPLPLDECVKTNFSVYKAKTCPTLKECGLHLVA